MYDKYSRPGQTYLSGLLILVGALALSFFVGSLAAGALWVAMTGKSIFTMAQDMLDPKNASAIRVVQLVSTFIIFFLPAWAMAMILNRKPFRFLGFNNYITLRQAGIVWLIVLAAIPFAGSLAELNKLIPVSAKWATRFKDMEDAYAAQVKVLSKIGGPGEYLLSLLIMAIAPALFEETLFRGGLQNLLTRLTRNPWIAIGVTSIIFSAIHFSFYGFIPRIALGVVLGLLFYYSENLWLPIIAHALNNSLVVTQIYYYTLKGKPVEEAMNETYPLWYGLIALGILVILFRTFRINSGEVLKAKKPKEDVALEEQWLT